MIGRDLRRQPARIARDSSGDNRMDHARELQPFAFRGPREHPQGVFDQFHEVEIGGLQLGGGVTDRLRELQRERAFKALRIVAFNGDERAHIRIAREGQEQGRERHRGNEADPTAAAAPLAEANRMRTALLADPELTERQKQVLLEIYESFRRENGDGAVRQFACIVSGVGATTRGTLGVASRAWATR